MARKPKKMGPKPNASEIARRAGCSRQLVSRLLARGFTEEQIVQRGAEKRLRAVEKKATMVTNGFPAIPWPSFAQSEARKEHLLAELREVQLQKERGELIPTHFVRMFIGRLLIEARNILMAGPSELADILAAEVDPRHCEAITRRWLERALERIFQCEKIWQAPEVA